MAQTPEGADLQVCGADTVNALSSTPTRLYADTWVALTYYCRYIKQAVAICNLLRIIVLESDWPLDDVLQ